VQGAPGRRLGLGSPSSLPAGPRRPSGRPSPHSPVPPRSPSSRQAGPCHSLQVPHAQDLSREHASAAASLVRRSQTAPTADAAADAAGGARARRVTYGKKGRAQSLVSRMYHVPAASHWLHMGPPTRGWGGAGEPRSERMGWRARGPARGLGPLWGDRRGGGGIARRAAYVAVNCQYRIRYAIPGAAGRTGHVPAPGLPTGSARAWTVCTLA
jgi:hypothetical protein